MTAPTPIAISVVANPLAAILEDIPERACGARSPAA
jgi:hypothetical protein